MATINVGYHTADDATLTALDGTYYSAANLKKFTVNDKLYAAGTAATYGGSAQGLPSYNKRLDWSPVCQAVFAATNATFGPNGCALPASLAHIKALAPIPVPATAWTTGQKATLGDASTCYWNGTTWIVGTAP